MDDLPTEERAAWTQLGTSTISDALDAMSIVGQCSGLFPLDRCTSLVGRAFTVSYVPAQGTAGTVGDYIDDLGPGQVVVLDNKGRTDATVWGEILTATAHQRHVEGTVIDGVCRDSEASLRVGYPIFARGRWMRTGKDRVVADAYDIPVIIGGVRVSPGDLLVGDADGVVCVPAEHVCEVLDVGLRIARAEERIREAVASGEPLASARRAYKYHTLQTARRQLPTGDRGAW